MDILGEKRDIVNAVKIPLRRDTPLAGAFVPWDRANMHPDRRYSVPFLSGETKPGTTTVTLTRDETTVVMYDVPTRSPLACSTKICYTFPKSMTQVIPCQDEYCQHVPPQQPKNTYQHPLYRVASQKECPKCHKVFSIVSGAFIGAFIFPLMLSSAAFKLPGAMGVAAGICILGFLLTLLLPEPNQKSLETIEQEGEQLDDEQASSEKLKRANEVTSEP